MKIVDISFTGVIIAYGLVLLPFITYRVLGVPLYRRTVVSLGRMTGQLLLVGVYLSFIFRSDTVYLTGGYVLLMVAVATWTMLRNAGLSFRMLPVLFPAFVIAVFTVLLYIMVLVINVEPFYTAWYFIPVGGMLIGNSMNRSIITLERFFSGVRMKYNAYTADIAMGATVREALLPHIAAAYRAGIAPSLANIATIGLVFLPGMMTGQILGGTDPSIAVKYQIVIMCAILGATEITAVLSLVFSVMYGFTAFGMLRGDIFSEDEDR